MIRVRQTTLPGLPPLAVFRNHERAAEHLCDHLLTLPEAQFWFLLLPGCRELLDPDDEGQLYGFARALWVAPPPQGEQPLYEGYARAIEAALDASLRLGWRWEEEEYDSTGNGVWHGLGPLGVHVVWDERVVRSAFLPAYAASPPDFHVAPAQRPNNPLPRRGTWRGRLPRSLPTLEDLCIPTWVRLDAIDVRQWCYELFQACLARARREYAAAQADGRVLTPWGLAGPVEYETWRGLYGAGPDSQLGVEEASNA
jgi:hypothetical protein